MSAFEDRSQATRSVVRSGVGWLLFLTAFLGFAAFHAGGGWNQNARFAMTRAIVEQGRVTIDDYLVYVSDDVKPTALRRLPVVQGRFIRDGRLVGLAWNGSGTAVAGPSKGELVERLDAVAATGDVAYVDGHFHPNKAPGVSWLAVPAYFVLHQIDRARGLDPDDSWVLTRNAWLTTALSLGLLSALGVVVFARSLLEWVGVSEPQAVVASLVFAFGTPYFAYATISFAANLVAVALLISFSGLMRDRERLPSLPASVASGFAAGVAITGTYAAVLALPWLAAYALIRGGVRTCIYFGVGLAAPVVALGVYHTLNFGAPWATAYAFQDPLFQGSGGFGVLEAPQLDRALGVLVSPFRGLLFVAPLVVFVPTGAMRLWRSGVRAEVGLCLSLFAAFFAFNICFNGWHGGWNVGPRYLVPALPFLALLATAGAVRFPRSSVALATASVAMMTLFVAVDPQPSVGVSSIAARPDRTGLWRSPLSEYIVPVLLRGRATPILDAQLEDRVQRIEARLEDAGAPPDELRIVADDFRAKFVADQAGAAKLFPLAAFRGPVSANPTGIYEAWMGQVLARDSAAARWNSFNVGEFAWPESRASLGLVVIGLSALSALTFRSSQRRDRSREPVS